LVKESRIAHIFCDGNSCRVSYELKRISCVLPVRLCGSQYNAAVAAEGFVY